MRPITRRRRAALLATAVLAAGALGGYTAASAAGDDPAPVNPNTGRTDRRAERNAQRASDRAALVGGQSETYSGIAPCRVVDTRSAGGPITATRNFKVSGNLSAQGGASNCGIPDNASSIVVNLTGITTGGTGFFRAWAFGGAPSVATLLNYAPGLNPTNQVNIPLCRKPLQGADPCTGGNAFTVRNFGSAHLVADAVGYYTPPTFAYVSDQGTLVHGSGVLSSSKLSTGEYAVRFDRDVLDCAALANDIIWDEHNEASADIGTTDDTLIVTISSADDTFRDSWFVVLVTC